MEQEPRTGKVESWADHQKFSPEVLNVPPDILSFNNSAEFASCQNMEVSETQELSQILHIVESEQSVSFEALKPGYLLCEFRNYRLEKKLGEGGMGQTWLAAEISGGREVRKVVCKILSERLRGDARAMEEVRRVFELTQKLNHQNICPLYGIKSDPEFGDFLVMGYAAGETLADWFHNQPGAENGLSLETILPIIQPIAEALDHVHQSGIIHRDVKPQNVIFSHPLERRKPWLIDFGIAARIRNCKSEEWERKEEKEDLGKPMDQTTPVYAGVSEVFTAESCGMVGTPFYMAPEQIEGLPQTGKADQYALASMVYELLSGRLPYQGKNLMELGMQKMKALPPLPKLSPFTNEALARALSVDPEKRFSSCTEFVRALEVSKKSRGRMFRNLSVIAGVLIIAGIFFGKELLFEIVGPEDTGQETVGLKYDIKQKETSNSENIHSDVPVHQEAGERLVLSYGGIEYPFRWCPPKQIQTEEKSEVPELEGGDTGGFWILETEVTQRMFQSVTGKNPSLFAHPEHPVENVDWLEAVDFCRKLSEILKQKISLPKESQWVYACRAGTRTAYFFGDSSEELFRYGNYCEVSNSDGMDWQDTAHDDGFDKTAPVGSFLPNAWGLYDVHGNVWEWCVGDVQNTADPESPVCVFRGGGWGDRAESCQFDCRYVNAPKTRHALLGFRIVLSE